LHTIGPSAFAYCASLISIYIPASVHRIAGCCFEHCSGLSQVAFAAGSHLVAIDSAIFEECLKLELIIMPQCVAARLERRFRTCEWRPHVVIEPDFVISGFETIAPWKQVENIPGDGITVNDAFLAGYQMVLHDLMIGQGG
jgi:hypothetical protein